MINKILILRDKDNNLIFCATNISFNILTSFDSEHCQMMNKEVKTLKTSMIYFFVQSHEIKI